QETINYWCFYAVMVDSDIYIYQRVKQANSYLTVISTAITVKKLVNIRFNPKTSKNVLGNY
ncbi:MAG: hypothetical protein ACXAEU_15920, partial [Candidatus Hodarchaeales archaeon]